MEELLQLVLKTYGIAGVVMMSPLGAVVYLWKENKDLHNKISDLANDHADRIEEISTKVVAAQSQRVDDAHAVMEKFVTLVGETSEAMKETNIALSRLADMVQMLINQHQQPVRERRPQG